LTPGAAVFVWPGPVRWDRLAAGTLGAALRLSRSGVCPGLFVPWFVLLVMEWFCFSS
jgi:hypothetical protein